LPEVCKTLLTEVSTYADDTDMQMLLQQQGSVNFISLQVQQQIHNVTFNVSIWADTWHELNINNCKCIYHTFYRPTS